MVRESIDIVMSRVVCQVRPPGSALSRVGDTVGNVCWVGSALRGASRQAGAMRVGAGCAWLRLRDSKFPRAPSPSADLPCTKGECDRGVLAADEPEKDETCKSIRQASVAFVSLTIRPRMTAEDMRVPV
jgi:hypothetical protein